MFLNAHYHRPQWWFVWLNGVWIFIRIWNVHAMARNLFLLNISLQPLTIQYMKRSLEVNWMKMCIFILHRCLLVCSAPPLNPLAGHYAIKQSCGHIEQIYCENMLTFKQFPPSRLWTIKHGKADLLFPSLKRRLLYKKSHVFPFVEK